MRPPAPIPCTDTSTLTNVAAFPKWSVSAKIADSQNPRTSIVSPNPTSMWPSTRSPTRWRTPPVSWVQKVPVSGSEACSLTGIEAITTAATRKDAASTSATTQPPVHAKSAAPRSGPKSR